MSVMMMLPPTVAATRPTSMLSAGRQPAMVKRALAAASCGAYAHAHPTATLGDATLAGHFPSLHSFAVDQSAARSLMTPPPPPPSHTEKSTLRNTKRANGLKKRRPRSDPPKHAATTSADNTSLSTMFFTLMRMSLLHLPLAAFAGVQLSIALIVAPFLLMLAIGVACCTAFLAALLDLWNPQWWCALKQRMGALMCAGQRRRKASKTAKAATATSAPVKQPATTTTTAASNNSRSEKTEKPLYEQLIEDEQRRVRAVTEKLRAGRRRATTLSHPPSAIGLVTGLAHASDLASQSVPSRQARPVPRAHHRPETTPLARRYAQLERHFTATAATSMDGDQVDGTAEMDGEHAVMSASYRDAAAELAALFRATSPTSPTPRTATSPLSWSTRHRAPLPKSPLTAAGYVNSAATAALQRATTPLVGSPLRASPILATRATLRPERVGMTRMA